MLNERCSWRAAGGLREPGPSSSIDSSCTYGNLTWQGEEAASLQWNAQDKLSYVGVFGGSSLTFRYDADGARSMRITGAGAKTHYLDGLIDLRLHSSGDLDDIYFRIPDDGGRVVAIKRLWESTISWYDRTYYYHNDNLGSSSIVSQASSSPFKRISYGPWGRARSATNWSSLLADWVLEQTGTGFTGHDARRDLSFINMGGRLYDPNYARFLSADPVVSDWTDGQAYNRYSYVLNRPTVLVDPTGFNPAQHDGGDVGGGSAGPDHDAEIEEFYRVVCVNASGNGCNGSNFIGPSDNGVFNIGPVGGHWGGNPPDRQRAEDILEIARAKGINVVFANDPAAMSLEELEFLMSRDQIPTKREELDPLKNLQEGMKIVDGATKTTLEWGSYVNPWMSLMLAGIELGDAAAAGDEEGMAWAALGIVTSKMPGGSKAARAGPKALPAPKARPAHPRPRTPEHGTFHVDPRGNVIPVPKGGRLTGSPDGRFMQARDAAGNPTGVRLDGGHRASTHPDPRAQKPHGHVPGVTNSDGTPWLPVK